MPIGNSNEGSSNELQKLTDSLKKSTSRYGMKIYYENCKILVNDPHPHKCNSNNLTINMYEKTRTSRLNILGLHQKIMLMAKTK